MCRRLVAHRDDHRDQRPRRSCRPPLQRPRVDAPASPPPSAPTPNSSARARAAARMRALHGRIGEDRQRARRPAPRDRPARTTKPSTPGAHQLGVPPTSVATTGSAARPSPRAPRWAGPPSRRSARTGRRRRRMLSTSARSPANVTAVRQARPPRTAASTAGRSGPSPTSTKRASRQPLAQGRRGSDEQQRVLLRHQAADHRPRAAPPAGRCAAAAGSARDRWRCRPRRCARRGAPYSRSM